MESTNDNSQEKLEIYYMLPDFSFLRESTEAVSTMTIMTSLMGHFRQQEYKYVLKYIQTYFNFITILHCQSDNFLLCGAIVMFIEAKSPFISWVLKSECPSEQRTISFNIKLT